MTRSTTFSNKPDQTNSVSSHPITPGGDFVRTRISLAASVAYFAFYAFAIDVSFLHSLPLSGIPRILLTTLFAWLTLRLNVVWLCAALFTHIAIESSIHDAPNNWMHSISYTLLACALLSWRTRFHVVRDRMIDTIHLMRTNTNSITSRMTDELLCAGIWLGAGVSIVWIATSMLTNNPLSGGRDKWISWSIENREVLWPGPTLVVLVIAVGIVLREWSIRSKSRTQALLSLRNERVLLQFPDLLRTVRYRIKYRTKKSNQSTKGVK